MLLQRLDFVAVESSEFFVSSGRLYAFCRQV
jgi:hypothetical protein